MVTSSTANQREHEPVSRLREPAIRAGRLRLGASTLRLNALRAAVIVVGLALWQYLPQVQFLSSRVRFLDPFFISSPTAVFQRIDGLLTGVGDSIVIWPYLTDTMEAAVLGAIGGLVLGLVGGLVLSSSKGLAGVFWPFVVLANSAPRIALVPIIIMLFGVGIGSSVVSALLVVFFLAFFSSYTGGMTIPPSIIETSRLLGATKRQIMTEVRLRYSLQWTFATVPNAVAFGLIAAVTTELLSGSPGIGSLLLQATTNLDADLTFALVIVLAVIGWILTAIAETVRRRALHWVE